MSRKHFMRVIAGLAILILSTMPLMMQAQTPEGWVTPDALQNMVVLDINNEEVALSQYASRPMLLHLWATWCAPCVTEIPSIARLTADYTPRGLVVVPLSEDFSTEKVERFFRRYQITNLPVLLDPGSKIFNSLRTRGLPISILIDAQGREVRRFAGNTNWDDPAIRTQIDALLK
jgi:thiol-disulfide isomerase/thioredoxin